MHKTKLIISALIVCLCVIAFAFIFIPSHTFHTSKGTVEAAHTKTSVPESTSLNDQLIQPLASDSNVISNLQRPSPSIFANNPKPLSPQTPQSSYPPYSNRGATIPTPTSGNNSDTIPIVTITCATVRGTYTEWGSTLTEAQQNCAYDQAEDKQFIQDEQSLNDLLPSP